MAGRNRMRALKVGRFEVRKVGLVTVDFRDPYHIAATLPWPWLLLLLLATDLTLNLVFALLYLVRPGSVANAHPGSLVDAFFFSLETFATVGYGAMYPSTLYGHIVSGMEILCGLGFTAIVTGLLFVRFSRPRARIAYAANAIVTPYRGRTVLMLRIGNARATLLSNATAKLYVMLADDSPEEPAFRRVHELPLLRPHLPVFALTWTLIHEIGETSPLFGYDASRVAAEAVRLFVTVEAHDTAMAADVQDLRDYSCEEILFDVRYADAVHIGEDGSPVADLTKVGALEPLPRRPDANAQPPG